jgi:hypothetical protein
LRHPGLGLDQDDQRVCHFGLDRCGRGGFATGATSVGAAAIAVLVDQTEGVGCDQRAGICCRSGRGRPSGDGLVGHWSIRPPV